MLLDILTLRYNISKNSINDRKGARKPNPRYCRLAVRPCWGPRGVEIVTEVDDHGDELMKVDDRGDEPVEVVSCGNEPIWKSMTAETSGPRTSCFVGDTAGPRERAENTLSPAITHLQQDPAATVLV